MPGGYAGGGGESSKAAVNSDPFTGGSSYHTGGGGAASAVKASPPSVTNTMYPVTDFVGFHTANVEGILSKITLLDKVWVMRRMVA